MTIARVINERCQIVANKDGTIKTAFVDRLGVTAEGIEYNAGQQTLSESDLAAFIGQVGADALKQRDAALEKLAEDTKALVEAHKTALNELQTALDASNVLVKSLQERLVKLFSEFPFNDGLIKIEAFMERCKPYMARLMFAANDEIPANGFGDIVSILNAKSKIGEPVNLNSTMFDWALSKIRTLDNVTEEEIATLTKPASREEAYIEVFGE